MNGAICHPTFGNVCEKNMVAFVNNRLVKSNIINYAIWRDFSSAFFWPVKDKGGVSSPRAV
jgi:DNA mismatch repair ATPase MutL